LAEMAATVGSAGAGAESTAPDPSRLRIPLSKPILPVRAAAAAQAAASEKAARVAMLVLVARAAAAAESTPPDRPRSFVARLKATNPGEGATAGSEVDPAQSWAVTAATEAGAGTVAAS